jgi:plastocyanin
VRRTGLAILAAAALLAGAVPAWSGDDGKSPPVAELSVSPEPVVAGEPVALDASRSRDADGSVTSYAWDLDGDGSFERQSGSGGTLAHAFETAGQHSVGVRVVDDSGDSADARKTVAVAEPPAAEPAAEPESAAEPEPAAGAEPAAAPEPEPAAKPAPASAPAKPRAASTGEQDAEQPATRLQAAASQTVSIRDFSFAPKSVSVSVGDTVTWNNTGEEVHTATARDGSFDTGNIASGGSGSATFRKAGTFSYFCKPHAFMTATVTVTGSGSGGGADTQGATGTGDDGAAGDGGAADGDDLPSTGLSLAPFLLTGLAMIGSGVALRRRCAKTAV